MTMCITRSREARLRFYREKTTEAHEAFKEAERQRTRQFYKENRKAEIDRVAKWHKKQGQVTVTCDICKIQLKKISMKEHIKSLKHIKNLNCNEITK